MTRIQTARAPNSPAAAVAEASAPATTEALVGERAPISVVVPTFNPGPRLAACLEALVPAAVGGLIRDVVVSDGGSTAGRVADVADAFGARFVVGVRGRGAQLARGAAAARGAWLLFVHADTVLEDGWIAAASHQIATPDGGRTAAVFQLAFNAPRVAARIVAAGAMARTRLLASPYGDQGLLVSRALYDAVGGYKPMPLFEDVDILDRIKRRYGRRAVRILPARAVTAADRYELDGYARRVARNAVCMALYRLGRPVDQIAAFYAAERRRPPDGSVGACER